MTRALLSALSTPETDQNEIFERVTAVLHGTRRLGPEFFDLKIRLVEQETRDVRAEQAAHNARPTARPPARKGR